MILSGGDIRGGTNYPADSRFTMESLKNEIQTELSICVVQVPGRVLAEGIPASQFGPNPGYLQFDDEIVQESDGFLFCFFLSFFFCSIFKREKDFVFFE